MNRCEAWALAGQRIAEGLAKIEVAERRAAENADTVSRLHHSLAKHGWHPGRTNDQLSDLVELALANAPAGPYANKRGFCGENSA